MDKFIIYNRFPTCNEYVNACRRNPYAGANLKKKHTDLTADLVKAWINNKRIEPFQEKVNLKVVWLEKNRKRDPDNVYFGIKFILDGLVKGGLLKNDTQEYIGEIAHSIKVDSDLPQGVIIEFIKSGGAFNA